MARYSSCLLVILVACGALAQQSFTEDFSAKRALQESESITIFVSTTGSDVTGDGSEGNPYATIQHAIDLAVDGDEVCVQPGTYTGAGNRDIYFLGKAITVRSCTGDPTTTIIDCLGTEADPHRGFVFQASEGSQSILQDITITGGNGYSYGGGILIGSHDGGYSSGPMVLRCVVEGNTADYGAGIAVFSDSPEVADAIIDSCIIEFNFGCGLYTNYLSEVVISECEIRNNTDSGILVEGGGEDGAPSVLDCRVSDNGNHGIELGHSVGWVYPRISGCDLTGNSNWGVLYNSGEDLVAQISENFISNNGMGGMHLVGGQGTIISDCEIENNQGPGLVLGVSFGWEIADCVVVDNRGHGISFANISSPNIEFREFYDGRVLHSEISLNDGRGINFQRFLFSFNVRECLIVENGLEGIGLSLEPGVFGQLDVDECTIAFNGAAGISHSYDLPCNVTKSLIAFNSGPGIQCNGPEVPQLACTDIWGNAGGDWENCISQQFGVGGNISENPLFCQMPSSDLTLRSDSPCLPNHHPEGYKCGTIGALGIGCYSLGPSPRIGREIIRENDLGSNSLNKNHSGVDEESMPPRASLLGAVPNPFNPSTKISFEMAIAGSARLKVFDTSGRLVATLLDETLHSGRHEVFWNGRDSSGRLSAAGVYLYQLEVGKYKESKRMMLVK